MTNDQVVQEYVAGRAAEAENLVSDGVSLWSYGWWEVARWVEGEMVVRQGEMYSSTASKHMSALGRLMPINLWNSVVWSADTPREDAELVVEGAYNGTK